MMTEEDSFLYLEEQDRIYSRDPTFESVGPKPFLQQNAVPPLPPLPALPQYPTRGVDSKSLLGRVKNMLFKGPYGNGPGGFPIPGDQVPIELHTQLKKQEQLWKIIKEKPFDPAVGLAATPPSRGSSGDTFLSGGADLSPRRQPPPPATRPAKAVSGLMNNKENEAAAAKYYHSGALQADNEQNSTAALELLTNKILGHRKIGLKKIQDRLNEIAEKKFAVNKLYGKLTQEFNIWSNDVVESEEGLRLVEELQRVLKLDMLMEKNSAQKFRDLAFGLNFIKLREDQMLLAKKELNSDIRKYENVRTKKGEYHEETSYWKEIVNTKQNSLAEVTILYQQALAKTMRELFTLSCVTFYENCTEMKEACKQFFSDSMEYLAGSLGEEYVDEYLDELRKRRADKKWAKLSFEDKNNPNKLAELIGNMYNGDDSLLSNVPKKHMIKFSAEAILKEEFDPVLKEKEPKLHFGTGLEEDWSQFPTEKYNGIASNKYFLERQAESIRNLDSHGNAVQNRSTDSTNKGSTRTLRGINPKYTRPAAQPLATTKEEVEAEESPKPSVVTQSSVYKTLRPSSQQLKQPGTEKSYQEVVMKFGSDIARSLDLRFKEAEEELNTNKWVSARTDG
ncbi:AFR130Wp [Eremothecium gossypii ATCC 10895]|uniref:AFR130Wp n=1 Tax=Eremothecium gossypii (strain ATCC 10895 / CBS 109.51 / FGSC 9923 / NRRL Y-1056) TaxID=284811 RepID=Q754E0_EREGS|nr:AFR130Wp [Eremothecium gossypii ATCC 10895]AAS53501.1 AFR130Wp [Eremothecium gossypii ATCC 10895]AEY97813.1 FAFR130Wp [Eremothecium gossypii FDAG1]